MTILHPTPYPFVAMADQCKPLKWIRLFASMSPLEAAEVFVEKLVERFGEKNTSLDQIKSLGLVRGSYAS